MTPSDFAALPSDLREPGLYERTNAADGMTTVWIVGHGGEELWTSRIRTVLLDEDTRGILRAWTSERLRCALRERRSAALKIVG